MAFPNFRSLQARNFATFKASPVSEISGSVGDLGTLLPLMIALAVNNSISLSSTLVFSGLWNILTGMVFGIPLPVQPMKAIAAVSLSRTFTVQETISAGLTVSFIILFFSITGSLRFFTQIIPIPVVKGIQVGAGLSLVISAGTSLLQPLGWRTPTTADNLLWVALAFLTLLLTQNLPRLPYALLILLLGLVLSFLSTPTSSLPSFSLWHPQLYLPTWLTLKTTFLTASLGQIPLTTLNSIIAVHHLSSDLLPNFPAPSVTSIGISVSLMNLIECWSGAMPVCHGSGGLAAQYRFGARSGASVIILGIFKIVLGLVCGESLVGLLGRYPRGLLGVMVVAAGLELVKVGENLNFGARDLWEVEEQTGDGGIVSDEGRGKRQRVLSEEERKERWMVMFVTVSGLLAFKNDGVGFVAGMLCHFIYQKPGVESLWRGLRTKWRAHEQLTRSAGEEERLLAGS